MQIVVKCCKIKSANCYAANKVFILDGDKMAFRTASRRSNSMEEGISAFTEVMCALHILTDQFEISAQIRGFPGKETVRL